MNGKDVSHATVSAKAQTVNNRYKKAIRKAVCGLLFYV